MTENWERALDQIRGDYAPKTPFEQGLEQTIAWWRERAKP
jgi:nucleoside-diphosphate-sugar epimerase